MSLVKYLKESGSQKVHNVDNLLLRESMDVIGAAQNQLALFALVPAHKSVQDKQYDLAFASCKGTNVHLSPAYPSICVTLSAITRRE